MKNKVHRLLGALALLPLCVTTAHAAQISRFSPQGEVAQVQQITIRFDSAVVPLGNPQAPAPVKLQCEPAAGGSGHWLNERQWVFDFAQRLPAGTTCKAEVDPAFRTPEAKALAGPQRFEFATGGPVLQQSWPYPGETVDEDQQFLLRFASPVDRQSVVASSWCALEGLGERVPVRLVGGDQRAALVKAQGWGQAPDAASTEVVALECTRRLTPSARLRLVVGKGVATASGTRSRLDQVRTFTVREPFGIGFSCERENAQAACMPLAALRLNFSAPVPLALAQGVRLRDLGSSALREPSIDPDEKASGLVESLRFEAPLAEAARYQIELPANFKDDSGRALNNAAAFPLKVATGAMPPLAKFAASPFGVLERLADPDGQAVLPLTVRHVEKTLRLSAVPVAQVSDVSPQTDADIIAWTQRLQRFDRREIERSIAKVDARTPLPQPVGDESQDWVQTRMVSLLQGLTTARELKLPASPEGQARPFEVLGIPLAPGFHVLELASPRLGEALLDARHGKARTMYVRSSALVTNLGVHFKLGRENALAWVTTLDKGKPVAGAQVQISTCKGVVLAQAKTDAQGRALFDTALPKAPNCEGGGSDGEDEMNAAPGGYFVSARATGADGVADLAFVWSDWDKGIENWRFNLPTDQGPAPTQRAHSVLDRSLLRVGDTLSMKHLLRQETRRGLALPASGPAELVIRHAGSGQSYRQPLQWAKTRSGGFAAQSRWTVPPGAKLGVYELALQSGGENGPSVGSGQFRVEAFRLPVFAGLLSANGGKPLVAVGSVPVDLQLNYVSGGPAAGLPAQVSAQLRDKFLSFGDHEGFRFESPRETPKSGEPDAQDAAPDDKTRLVADKLPLTLDAAGHGSTRIDGLKAQNKPQDLVIEASYSDPSGEIQTLRQVQTLWPAAVVAGIQAEDWIASGQKVTFTALALDLKGQPAAGVALAVRARAFTTSSTRKRMVGGFYTYDNQTSVNDLGVLCEGKSDARGQLVCTAELKQAGEVELVASARDSAGRSHQSAATVYVTRQGEIWFGGQDHDRMDLIPEQRAYQPGETARLQVRMPFRHATALVSIEREGVIDSRVVQLSGQNPTVELKVGNGWGPNVFVSVLALRGRLREVPWYSFFTWGFKAPREWWTSFWYDGREIVAPTALVDLSKPAYRLGVAELRVGLQAHEIQVKVEADRASYPVRGKAQVKISATLADGKPAAHAEVSLAAVDQALLELGPNTSWNLLDAMLQRRGWGVATSTAQMEIIGRRHFGRKAVPAGGGGGRSPTRELFDTLLLWQPQVQLDANGRATVDIPLNDSISGFEIVAVAEAGSALFGTGRTSIRTAQDLQIISGLPPLVREGDVFTAGFTLRNSTAKAMDLTVSARATGLTLAPQKLQLPAGASKEIRWDVVTPAALGQIRSQALLWELSAQDSAGKASDAIKLRQQVLPAVPITVQQASLVQLDGPLNLALAPPPQAVLGLDGKPRGGVSLAVQAQLADGLPAVRDWFQRYPYSCLEQQTSKALGLGDAAAWKALGEQLPSYLDGDGLASYFPASGGETQQGSDTLSAYLLAASHEAAALDPAFALPPAALAALQRGLASFVEGRIERRFWSPRSDLSVRKLAAIEALSRYGLATPAQVQSLAITPNLWPTHALIDWYQVLQRLKDLPQREQRQREVSQVLLARLSYQGARVGFANEDSDAWWWLMKNGDGDAARLLLAVVDDPLWKPDAPRLASGLIARQQRGAWATTTSNLWGTLALQKFSARFEATPVSGTTTASLGGQSARFDWTNVSRATPGGPWRNNSAELPWPAPGAPAPLAVNQQGSGKPWLSLQATAAVPRTTPLFAGYQVRKTIDVVQQAVAGRYSRGDVLRITLDVVAASDMAWVVVADPVPGGATLLGGGLGRDSVMASAPGAAPRGNAWPVFEERGFEAYRAYFDHLPRGRVQLQYSLRLNNVGDFALPATRVEAMYAPEVFGEAPNARVVVKAAP